MSYQTRYYWDISECKKRFKKRWWCSFLLSPFRPCFPSSLPSSFPPFLPAPFQMHYWVKNALPCCASCSQRALCPSKNPIVFWQWPPATGIENIWPIQSLTYMLSKCLNSKEVPWNIVHSMFLRVEDLKILDSINLGYNISKQLSILFSGDFITLKKTVRSFGPAVYNSTK